MIVRFSRMLDNIYEIVPIEIVVITQKDLSKKMVKV